MDLLPDLISSQPTHLEVPRKDIAREKRSLQNCSLLPICEVPHQLGIIEPNISRISFSYLETLYPEVNHGGWYKPSSCNPRCRIIVFIPYRDRADNLAILLRHLHPILIMQQLEYRIIVAEQEDSNPFNKGQLYNAAFIETLALMEEVERWDCFIFHDVDLLALYWNTPYKCGDQPVHISVHVDTLNYILPYYEMFGGVTALTYDMFLLVNGYSNRYWHWGAEDDDMSQRLLQMGYSIERPQEYVDFIMLPHQPQIGNPNRRDILKGATAYYKQKGQTGYDADGLTTATYNLVAVIKEHLFTLIRVSFDDGKKSETGLKKKPNQVILQKQLLGKLVLMNRETVRDRAIETKSETIGKKSEIKLMTEKRNSTQAHKEDMDENEDFVGIGLNSDTLSMKDIDEDDNTKREQEILDKIEKLSNLLENDDKW